MKKPNPHQRKELADAAFHVAGIFAVTVMFMGSIAITIQFVANDFHPRLNIAVLFWASVLFGASYWGWKNK